MTDTAEMRLEQLRERILSFRRERDWEQFHTPKNLAASVTIEAAELLEHFQWLQDGTELSLDKKGEVAEEVADVFIYLLLLSHELDIDLIAAAEAKLAENARSEGRLARLICRAEYALVQSRGHMDLTRLANHLQSFGNSVRYGCLHRVRAGPGC